MTGGRDSRGCAPKASAPTGRRAGGTGRGTAVLALALVLAPLAAAAEPAPASPPDGLTIAILDLDAAPALSPQTAQARPTWRTSFGAERVTRRAPDPDAAKAPLAALTDADAVLIQGVKAASPLRRLFPPRAWRLIVSRRIVATADGETSRAERPAATAIALRARPGLRVTARAHALRHADPAAAALHAALLPAAATAVRIVERGRTLWLASVTLPPSCHEDGAPCPARKDLDAWREARRQSGEATLIGGRLTPAPGAEADETGPEAALCTAHGIESDLASEPLPPGDGSGCISLVRLGN